MPGTMIRIWEEVQKSKAWSVLGPKERERHMNMIILLCKCWSGVAYEKPKEEKVICEQDSEVETG